VISTDLIVSIYPNNPYLYSIRLNRSAMRNVLLVLFFLALLPLVAQKTPKENPTNRYGWSVNANKLEWSKAYFADNNEISDFIKAMMFVSNESSVFDIQKVDDELLRGSFSNLTFEFEKYGYNYLDAPFLVSRARHSGSIEIELKDGKYKVTISDVVSFMNKVTQSQAPYVWNKDFIDRNGTIKEGMMDILEIANKNFTTTFSAKIASESTSNE